MTNRITKLKNALGIGARSNRFRVYITFPQGLDLSSTGLSETCDILCSKCDGFPEFGADSTEVHTQGRKLFIPKQGDNGGDWTATFYNSETHDLKRAFIAWAKAVDHPISNTTTGSPSDVSVTLKVAQLDSAENETVVGCFYEAFVTKVAGQDFDGSSAQDVEEFTVTWKYSWFNYGEDSENMRPEQYTPATKNKTAYNN